MAALEPFRRFLIEKLRDLEVDEDVFADFVVAILDDDDDDKSAKASAITEILSGAIENESLLSSVPALAESIVEFHEKAIEEASHEREAKEAEDDRKKLAAALEVASTGQTHQAQRGGERDAFKQRVLETYAVQADSMVQFEDGNIVGSTARIGCPQGASNADIWANDNRALVSQQQQAERERGRLQNQIEVKKRAELKEKEKTKKEKQKQRVAKQERRTGR